MRFINLDGKNEKYVFNCIVNMESSVVREPPFIIKAIPFMRTKAGKIYLLVGIACILAIILGIGFLIYTVRKTKKYKSNSYSNYSYQSRHNKTHKFWVLQLR